MPDKYGQYLFDHTGVPVPLTYEDTNPEYNVYTISSDTYIDNIYDNTSNNDTINELHDVEEKEVALTPHTTL